MPWYQKGPLERHSKGRIGKCSPSKWTWVPRGPLHRHDIDIMGIMVIVFQKKQLAITWRILKFWSLLIIQRTRNRINLMGLNQKVSKKLALLLSAYRNCKESSYLSWKLTLQKQSFWDYGVSGSSTKDVEENVPLLRAMSLSCPKMTWLLMLKKWYKSLPGRDFPAPMEFTRESLELGKHLDICIIRDKTPTIRRITRSVRKNKNKKTYL